MELLKLIFPALMVVGALGGLFVSLLEDGVNPTALQWLGAMLLYTALTIRNVR